MDNPSSARTRATLGAEPLADESMRVLKLAPLVRTQVQQILREAIGSRRFAPGQRLVERELIELTGVSRTTIREALRELAAEGLVRSVPNKGMVVTALTRKEVEQVYELRMSLESLAGRLFVTRGTDDQTKQLRMSFERIEQCVDRSADLLQAKDEFYDILFAGAANDALQSVVAGLHGRIRAVRSISLDQAGRSKTMLEEVRAIVEAVERKDATAAELACADHVAQAQATVLQAIDNHASSVIRPE